MAQLWGGRFTKETDKLVYNFNASISFDQKFYEQDIRGSKAHVKMLAKQGILTEKERDQILEGLEGILADVKAGRLAITSEYEDIHSFVEANLIDRIGDPGKKLHTGRSRNDQVALDMKLYVRDEIDEIDQEVKSLLEALQKIMEENVHTYMPGFTHLQKAQPVTLAHHVGAYFEMFRRDRGRLFDIRKRMNTCPLGAGALAGTTYPLDREYTAQLLDFDEPTRNSMDSVSDRDYVIELLSALSTVMMHLSRFSEEIILWNSNEYRFVEIDDAYSTGSSIMPQKKNPDIAELVRGKTGRVYGIAIVDWLTQFSEIKDATYVRGFLGRMLFAGDDGVKKMRVLSGGEKVRVLLSRMMIEASNVLILDEPTDHLDMESITALNNGLIKFPGVLLFASRDHQIVQTTANRIMEILPNGTIIDKITTYDEYLESDEMARKRQVYSMSSDDENDN